MTLRFSKEIFMNKSEILQIFQKNQRLYEEVVADLIHKCPVSGTFVDCGAHLGDHTTNMLGRPEADMVIAIEAIPNLANRLKDRFKLESRLKILQTAIGKAEGQTEFNIASNLMGYSGIMQRDISSVSSWEKLTVVLTTLDRLMTESGTPSAVRLIKLDLEGGEYDALLGGRETIASHRPFIVFENGLAKSANLYGYSWNEFSSLFEELDYVVYDFFGDRIDKKYWEAPLTTYMFVAVPANSILSNWYAEERLNIVSAIAKPI
jgi:FkbM family methyltransferase